MTSWTAEPVDQTDDGVTLAPKLTAEANRLEPRRGQLDRHVLGAALPPMAWTMMTGGSDLNVSNRWPGPPEQPYCSGSLSIERRRVLVGTETVTSVGQVQPAGKQVMGALTGRASAATRSGSRVGARSDVADRARPGGWRSGPSEH